MLPSINLQFGDLRSPDTPHTMPGLLPEGADILDGGFADKLQLRAYDHTGGADTGGEDLPVTGSALPLVPDLTSEQIAIAGELAPGSDKFGYIDPIPSEPDDVLLLEDMLAGISSGEKPDVNAAALLNADGELPELELVETAPIPTSVAEGTLPTEPGAEAVPVNPLIFGDSLLSTSTSTTAVADAAPVRGEGQAPATITPHVGRAGILAADGTRLSSTPRVAEAPGAVSAGTTVANPSAASLIADTRPRTSTRNVDAPLLAEPEVADTHTRSSIKRQGGTTPVEFDGLPRLMREDAPISPRLQPGNGPQIAQQSPESALITDASARTQADAAFTARPSHGQSLGQQVSTPVTLPVQESGWDRVISERVMMMANGRLQNAEIRLSPAELGPLRIQVAIEDGTTNVVFQAQHAITREAIEHAMPRLREMLAENGLTLGQANVSDDGVHEGGREHANPAGTHSAAATEDADLEDGVSTTLRTRVADGLVDTFA